MTPKPSFGRIIAVCLLAAYPVYADGPATPPATRPVNHMGDFIETSRAFSTLFPKLADLVDPAKRTASRQQGTELLHRAVADLDALMIEQPASRTQLLDARSSAQAILIALGDPQAKAEVDQQAKAGASEDAWRAQRAALEAKWYLADDKADAQSAVIDELERLAKENPADAALTQLAKRFGQTASEAQQQRITDLIVKAMQNPAADRFRAEIEADAKLHLLEGKPLTIAGKTTDGRDVKTSDWAGKVVLVDFWASWCGPCVAELPRVQKAFADYHDKGLEVIGVNNDYRPAAFAAFTAKTPMPWPQLIDPSAAANQEFNSITTRFGIVTIPQMFLIDKKGICRSVTARENLEELIPKLLAE